MDTFSLIQGLRFVDSFFPSGGFAFSSGLEAAVKDGAIHDGKEFARYVEEWLRNGIGRREVIAVAVGHQAATTGNLGPALGVDRALEGLKLGADSRRASKQMGRQVMKMVVDQFRDHRTLLDYGAAVAEARTPGHAPVAIGLTLAACGWSIQDTAAAFLYQSAQGWVSAAMKLLPVGQHQGQLMLAEWGPLIGQLSERVKPQASLASWSPIQDIYAMRHSRLESRLFRS
jgi:urease accessory protein